MMQKWLSMVFAVAFTLSITTMGLPESTFAVPSNCVTLYEHANHQGRSKTFCGAVSYVGNDFNDIASSLQLGSSLQSVTLYEHADHSGRAKTFHGSVPYVGNDFNDIASSLSIR